MVSRSIVIYLLFTLFCSLNAIGQTKQLLNFDELMQALNSGEKVRMVVHYAQCKLYIENKLQPKAPDAVTGMDIGTYEYFSSGLLGNKMAFVVFSSNELIGNPKGKGYVFNYGKVRVNADNTVKITAQFLNPKNYKIIMDEYFEGQINNGINNGGVYLYK